MLPSSLSYNFSVFIQKKQSFGSRICFHQDFYDGLLQAGPPFQAHLKMETEEVWEVSCF